jgi:citrate lyase subunit beta/citryl-CoA lyase
MVETFKIGSPRSLTAAGGVLTFSAAGSWLIVDPGSDMAANLATGADWIVLDLTAPARDRPRQDNGPEAWSNQAHRAKLAVLLPGMGEPHAQAATALAVQLEACAVCAPALAGADVQQLDGLLRVEEARAGIARKTAIMAFLDTMALADGRSFRRASRRLLGLAINPHPALHRKSDVARFARAQLVLAAQAAGVLAIDSLSAVDEVDAFREDCMDARFNGFAGKLTRRRHQVGIINEVFGNESQAPEGRTSSNTSDPPSA